MAPSHDHTRSTGQRWPAASQCCSRRIGRKQEDVRENETIAVNPFGVLGVEGHELVKKNVGHRGHAHRGTWMARVGFDGGIDLRKGLWSAIGSEKTASCADRAPQIALLEKHSDSGATVGNGGGAGREMRQQDSPRGFGWC